MRRLLFLSGFLLGQSLAVSTTYQIAHFSSEYHATVTVSGTSDDVFRPGVVRVYKSGSAKPIIQVKSDELAFDLKAGKVPANIKEIPYGEQSVLMYDDFNFDGRKDLAIMDGQNSCYHGPSFQIYLGVPGGFKHSPDITRLAQDYCGMFDVDTHKKRLNVMTKDGCCFHRFESYSLYQNKPVLEWREDIGDSDEDISDYYTLDKVTERKGKSYVSSQNYIFEAPEKNDEQYKVILSFSLQKDSKKMVYIIYNKQKISLDYIFVNDGNVELSSEIQNLSYAKKEPGMIDVNFSYEDRRRMLEFRPNDYKVSYTVFDAPGKLGVEVTQNGKVSFLAGNPASKSGSLHNILQYPVSNVAVAKP